MDLHINVRPSAFQNSMFHIRNGLKCSNVCTKRTNKPQHWHYCMNKTGVVKVYACKCMCRNCDGNCRMQCKITIKMNMRCVWIIQWVNEWTKKKKYNCTRLSSLLLMPPTLFLPFVYFFGRCSCSFHHALLYWCSFVDVGFFFSSNLQLEHFCSDHKQSRMWRKLNRLPTLILIIYKISLKFQAFRRIKSFFS